MKTLIIDNYDSFTYNLFQYVAEVTQSEPLVIKNDTHSISEILSLNVDNIILSPGPGHPSNAKDFGICYDVLKHYQGPILGVCLGHQGISIAFGGQVVHAPDPMHGQIYPIYHDGDTLFENLPHSFNVVRYHSLIVKNPLPSCLKVIARTKDNLIMGLRHVSKPIWGIQYHPESICSEYGKEIFENFNTISKPYQKNTTSIHLPIQIHHHKKKSRYELKIREIEFKEDTLDIFQQYYQKHQDVVWLDSRLIKNDSRFSIMGCLDGPLSFKINYDTKKKEIVKTQFGKQETINSSIFDYLNLELAKYRVLENADMPFQFQCGFVGYFGYELFSETLDIENIHTSKHPDAQFLFLDRAVVFDHLESRCYLLALVDSQKKDCSDEWFYEITRVINHKKQIENSNKIEFEVYEGRFTQSKLQYIENIKRCLDYIHDGDSYEICLTNRLKFNHTIDPFDYYKSLRQMNPTPYSAFLRFDELSIACSSMERFLKIDSNRLVETKPIKGTLPRGKTVVEDAELIKTLQNDIKFRSENLMIVDLLRNDLGKVCEIGSIHVPKLMQVESYKTVHQLVTTIQGYLKSEYSSIDCIKAVFPGGSMTGAPKKRTVEIIQKLETEARQIYSGAIGYLSLTGAIDLNIVIRTAEITQKEIEIGVGGAIIALSTPEDEYDEILLKSSTLKKALGQM